MDPDNNEDMLILLSTVSAVCRYRLSPDVGAGKHCDHER